MEFSFIGLDGIEYTFKTEVNSLNNSHMYTINDWTDCYSANKREVSRIIKVIKKNCKLIGD